MAKRRPQARTQRRQLPSPFVGTHLCSIYTGTLPQGHDDDVPQNTFSKAPFLKGLTASHHRAACLRHLQLQHLLGAMLPLGPTTWGW
eukprot:1156174-Pelagomonas_calceolata.AAC.3